MQKQSATKFHDLTTHADVVMLVNVNKSDIKKLDIR